MLEKAKKKVFNSHGVSVEKLFFFATDQRSSLFGPDVGDVEKNFITLRPGMNVIKLFTVVIYEFSQ